MTVRTTVVPDVLDYLVSTFQAASDARRRVAAGSRLRRPGHYGGTVTARPLGGLQDPESLSAPIGAESQEEWVGIGARQRNEYIVIHCVAEAWAGGTDVRTVRLAAYGILAAVEVLLQADPTLGGRVLFTDNSMPTRQLRQNNTADGQVARVYFSIKAKARIGGT